MNQRENMTEIAPEMRLFSPAGERLYLTADERKRFLMAVNEENRAERLFCQTLHYGFLDSTSII